MRLQALLAAVGLEDPELTSQEVVDRVADVGFVVHDQQGIFGGGLASQGSSSGKAFQLVVIGVNGRRTRNFGFRLTWGTFHLNLTTVPGHNPVADGQAKSGPFADRFGREKWIEQFGQAFWLDPRRRRRLISMTEIRSPTDPRLQLDPTPLPLGPEVSMAWIALTSKFSTTWLI